mmetsp:Transcript_4911/g.14230  ORF Transcript_4911/g.14230 Transcript_4911/m.14230 type:complete len:85 (+) Transcript_4911:776-1030(+)
MIRRMLMMTVVIMMMVTANDDGNDSQQRLHTNNADRRRTSRSTLVQGTKAKVAGNPTSLAANVPNIFNAFCRKSFSDRCATQHK